MLQLTSPKAALENDPQGICQPDSAIDYPEQPDTELEFQKVLGTGVDIWPATAKNYSWSLECTKLDPLNVWFTTPSNRDTWAHVSHTFTHQGLNNATYSDTYREVCLSSGAKSIITNVVRSPSTKHGSHRLGSAPKQSTFPPMVSSHRKSHQRVFSSSPHLSVTEECV